MFRVSNPAWLKLVVGLTLLAACGDGATPDTLILVEAWQLPVETICVESSERYGNAGGITPFTDRLVTAIESVHNDEYSDFLEPRIVEAECDITVALAVTGRAIPAEYSNTYGLSSTTLYLGWDVSGTLTVSAPGKEPQTIDLANHRDPPGQTRETFARYGQPESAIREAADGEWCSSFVGLFLSRAQDAWRGTCT